jgi:hypothetical protein
VTSAALVCASALARPAFGLTWVVFFTARWITKGFSSQQTARITNADASPAAVGGAAPRKCPRCGFSNAAEASRCPCGYGLNQKARDEERHQAAKTNWIWPKISDEA